MVYNRQKKTMQKKFLLIITMIAMLFTACNDKDDDTNSNGNTARLDTSYSIKNYTGSTITDIKIYELDANYATITSKHSNSCENGMCVTDSYSYYDYSFTANNDAVSVKVSYKIAGQTFSNTFSLRKGNKTEIAIERPTNLTTYTIEFEVSADWDDDDYLYYVEIDEFNSNGSVIQSYEYNKLYGLGTVLDEVKANSNTKTVRAYFYFYPDRGSGIYKSKEFQIIKGEYNEFIIYGSECSKNNQS